MGRDKSLLSVPGSGEMFWQRQWRTLEALRPEKIFWSGPAREGMPENAHLVIDEKTGAGPLAGVSACLDLLTSDLLVVLAVDLPKMDAAYLRDLLNRCTPIRGAVPQQGDFSEPLAAIYPKALKELAADSLREGRHTLQDFVRQALARNLVKAIPVNDEDAAKFQNVNSPADLS